MQSRQFIIGFAILIFACFISFGMGIKFEQNRATKAMKRAQLRTILPEEAWDLPQEAMEEIMAAGEEEKGTIDYTFQKRLSEESPDAQKIKQEKAKSEGVELSKLEAKPTEHEQISKKTETKKVSEEGPYIIQLGAFRDQDQAKRLAFKLKEKGYGAYTTESQVPGKGTWYRVRIGGISDPKKAEVILTRLEREENIKAFMIGTK